VALPAGAGGVIMAVTVDGARAGGSVVHAGAQFHIPDPAAEADDRSRFGTIGCARNPLLTER
jgi:hypothetical protein